MRLVHWVLDSFRVTERDFMLGHNPQPLEIRPQPVSSPDNQFLSPQKLVINYLHAS